jgi:cell division protein FtsB
MGSSKPPRHYDPPAAENQEKVWVRPLNRIPAWIKNKFFIAFAAFAVIILFLDKNDLFTQMDRNRQLRELLQSKQYFTVQIAAEQVELDKMKTNPRTLEKYAREKYLMKRDNEDLFLIPENYGDTKK